MNVADFILAGTFAGGDGGGGGSEDFIVTVTKVNNTYTSDKTYAEILAAYNAGKNIKCILNKDDEVYVLPLSGKFTGKE